MNNNTIVIICCLQSDTSISVTPGRCSRAATGGRAGSFINQRITAPVEVPCNRGDGQEANNQWCYEGNEPSKELLQDEMVYILKVVEMGRTG